jgi:arsenate reductase
MALGFFTHLAGEQAVAWSGGSEPGVEINPAAVQAMAEVGIDITEEFPKPWTDEFVQAADVVITMGCGDACPIYPGKRYEDWEFADPGEARFVDEVRTIRDEMDERITKLVAELLTPSRAPPRLEASPRPLFGCGLRASRTRSRGACARCPGQSREPRRSQHWFVPLPPGRGSRTRAR